MTRLWRVLAVASVAMSVAVAVVMVLTLTTMLDRQAETNARLEALARSNSRMLHQAEELALERTDQLRRLARRNEVLHGHDPDDAPALERAAVQRGDERGERSPAPDPEPRKKEPAVNHDPKPRERRKPPADNPKPKPKPDPPKPPKPPEPGPVEKVFERVKDLLPDVTSGNAL